MTQAWAVGCGFVLSRACCAGQVATLRRYDDSGMLAAFSRPMDKKAVLAAVAGWAAAAFLFLLWLDRPTALLTLAVVAGLSLYFRHMVYARFNGLSGDLAGWFVQMAELLLAAAIVMGGRI